MIMYNTLHLNKNVVFKFTNYSKNLLTLLNNVDIRVSNTGTGNSNDFEPMSLDWMVIVNVMESERTKLIVQWSRHDLIALTLQV